MTTNIYPGMLDTRIEYFAKDDNVFKIKDGIIHNFDEVSSHPLLENLISEDSLLRKTLHTMCSGDAKKMQKQLAHCRFGGLNFEADFDENGNPTHDFIDCPLRGNCIGENIVCKAAEINGVALNELQLEILRQCVTDKKNTAIAAELNLPEGTFNVEKNKTYKSIGVPTKQHLALTLVNKGLL